MSLTRSTWLSLLGLACLLTLFRYQRSSIEKAPIQYEDPYGWTKPPWTPSDECPSTIKARIPGPSLTTLSSGKQRTFPNTTVIHSALIHCPDIASLDLHIGLRGCVGLPDRFNMPFDPSGGESYPPIKHLGLEGYHFGSGSGWYKFLLPKLSWSERVWDTLMAPQRWIRGQLSTAEQAEELNVDLWLAAMDFSQIESLAYRHWAGIQGNFSAKITPKLTSLRELKLWTRQQPHTGTMAWIQSLPRGLRSLSWVEGRATENATLVPLERLLEAHGHSLERLELRCEESLFGRKPVFSVEQISRIGDAVPGLKHLSVDVNRDGEWPTEHLDAIMGIPQLETVDVWLEMASKVAREQPGYDWGRRDDEDFKFHCKQDDSEFDARMQRPVLTCKSTRMLFDYMRERKVGKELKKVVFYVGDWGRPADGLRLITWLEGRKDKWVCNASGCSQDESSSRS